MKRSIHAHLAMLHRPGAGGDATGERGVVGDQQDGAGVVAQRGLEALDRGQVEVVARLKPFDKRQRIAISLYAVSTREWGYLGEAGP